MQSPIVKWTGVAAGVTGVGYGAWLLQQKLASKKIPKAASMPLKKSSASSSPVASPQPPEPSPPPPPPPVAAAQEPPTPKTEPPPSKTVAAAEVGSGRTLGFQISECVVGCSVTHFNIFRCRSPRNQSPPWTPRATVTRQNRQGIPALNWQMKRQKGLRIKGRIPLMAMNFKLANSIHKAPPFSPYLTQTHSLPLVSMKFGGLSLGLMKHSKWWLALRRPKQQRCWRWG